MTDKQVEVAKQVSELLREHFDGYVLTLHEQDVNDKGDTRTSISYDGGIMLALGLAHYTQHKLQTRVWSEADEEDQREQQENES